MVTNHSYWSYKPTSYKLVISPSNYSQKCHKPQWHWSYVNPNLAIERGPDIVGIYGNIWEYEWSYIIYTCSDYREWYMQVAKLDTSSIDGEIVGYQGMQQGYITNDMNLAGGLFTTLKNRSSSILGPSSHVEPQD